MIGLLSVLLKIILFEKLVVGQFVKKSPSFYENLTFIIFFARPYPKVTEFKRNLRFYVSVCVL